MKKGSDTMYLLYYENRATKTRSNVRVTRSLQVADWWLTKDNDTYRYGHDPIREVDETFMQ